MKAFYQSLHNGIAERPALCRAVTCCTAVLPGVVYAAYPLLLVYLWIAQRGMRLRAVAVPAVGFLAVTALRAAINAPRPYEALGIPALTPKDTQGKSFPSRHAACAAVIAVTALKAVPPLGGILCVIALLIGLSRVLAGVHFVRDVLCGLLLGGAVGWGGLYLLP